MTSPFSRRHRAPEPPSSVPDRKWQSYISGGGDDKVPCPPSAVEGSPQRGSVELRSSGARLIPNTLNVTAIRDAARILLRQHPSPVKDCADGKGGSPIMRRRSRSGGATSSTTAGFDMAVTVREAAARVAKQEEDAEATTVSPRSTRPPPPPPAVMVPDERQALQPSIARHLGEGSTEPMRAGPSPSKIAPPATLLRNAWRPHPAAADDSTSPELSPEPRNDDHTSVTCADVSLRLASLLDDAPAGLARLVEQSAEVHPLHLLVADNSASMMAADGTILLRNERGKPLRPARSTRWEELCDSAAATAALAQALHARLDVQLLNRTPAQDVLTLDVGTDARALVASAAQVKGIPLEALTASLERVSPHGWTPLAEAVEGVHKILEPLSTLLRSRGQRAVVMIATDGKPDDSPAFEAAIARLQALPVWLVVRLCSSEEAVAASWAALDKHLEAPLEVLRDVRSEAAEVAQYNSWLAYGPALHTAREFGLHDKTFDLLDETKLLPSQVRRVCELLLDRPLPQPERDRAAFVSAVRLALQDLPPVYEPLRGELRPWIDCGALAAHLADAEQ